MKPTKLGALQILGVVAWLLIIGLLVALAEGVIPKTLRQGLLVLFLLGPLLLFGEAIIETVFHVVAYAVGRITLPAISFGRLRPEAEHDALSFRWYGIARDASGKCVASTDATALFGLLLMALAAATITASYLLFAR